MALITENQIRQFLLKNRTVSQFPMSTNDKLTPAALDFLKDHNLEIQYSSDKKSFDKLEFSKPINKPEWETHIQFINFYTKEILPTKPESMTHLFENILVYKDDPRIILRGKLDTLQSYIIDIQIFFDEKKRLDLVESLEDLLGVAREILKSEVMNQQFPDDRLILKMTAEEIRDKSHNPQKYFNLSQMALINYRQGAIVAKLNLLRAYSRECELVAVQTFRDGEIIQQNSLIKVLNRLSSCFHILMYQELSQTRILR